VNYGVQQAGTGSEAADQPGDHLHTLVDPAGVADAILTLSAP